MADILQTQLSSRKQETQVERGLIVNEFHQLRTYLNRANKLSNQKTELRFRIESLALFEYQLSVICIGSTESHHLALAMRGRSRKWESTGNTPFKNIENFCADILNLEESSSLGEVRSVQLSLIRIEQMERKISNQLKMLLLNTAYQP